MQNDCCDVTAFLATRKGAIFDGSSTIKNKNMSKTKSADSAFFTATRKGAIVSGDLTVGKKVYFCCPPISSSLGWIGLTDNPSSRKY